MGWLGAWPMRHSLGYGSWVGICHSRQSFPYNGSWWLWNTGASRRGAIALKLPKADVPPVGNWRSRLIVAVTLHFEMVVSGGKVAHLQRVGIALKFGRILHASLLGAACPSSIWGIGHHLLFDVPYLSSGLSSEQMVGFRLVHSLPGFLGCESWVRLN